jgi:hypothetical protein
MVCKKFIFHVVTDDKKYAGGPQRVEYFGPDRYHCAKLLKERFGDDATITFVKEEPYAVHPQTGEHRP